MRRAFCVWGGGAPAASIQELLLIRGKTYTTHRRRIREAGSRDRLLSIRQGQLYSARPATHVQRARHFFPKVEARGSEYVRPRNLHIARYALQRWQTRYCLQIHSPNIALSSSSQ